MASPRFFYSSCLDCLFGDLCTVLLLFAFLLSFADRPALFYSLFRCEAAWTPRYIEHIHAEKRAANFTGIMLTAPVRDCLVFLCWRRVVELQQLLLSLSCRRCDWWKRAWSPSFSVVLPLL